MTVRLDLRRHLASNAATKVAFIAVVVLCLGGRGAYAQSAEAEALFNSGNQLMSEGKLAQACEAFDASNHLEPRAGTLILLGQCREQNHQLASAWSAYKAALVRVKNQRYRELAQAKAAALEPRLSYLVVFVSDVGKIRGLALMRNGEPFDSILWNRILPVDGGDYVITGRAPEHEEWQTTVHVPVEGAKLSVEVPKLKELSNPVSPPATPMSSPVPAPGSPPQQVRIAENHEHDAVQPKRTQGTPPQRATSNVMSLAIGAGTLALLGGGVGFELWAESEYAAAKSEMTSQPRRDSLYNAANTKRHVALGLAGTGLVAGGAAVWLYLRDRNRERGPVAGTSVQVVPAVAGLAVLGQF